MLDLPDGRLCVEFQSTRAAADAADSLLDLFRDGAAVLDTSASDWGKIEAEWNWADGRRIEMPLVPRRPQPVGSRSRRAPAANEPWDMGPLTNSDARRLFKELAPLRECHSWPPAEQTREAILYVCSKRPMSATEMGAILGRSPGALTANYLRPMVTEGVLVKTHPTKRNHLDQRYVAAPGHEIRHK